MKNVRIFAVVMKNPDKRFTDAGIVAATFILLSALTYYICAPSLCFLEHTATYIRLPGSAFSKLCRPGACCRECALWLQQWFVSPAAASFIVGGICSVVVLSLDCVMARVARSRCLLPLALLPAFAVVLGHTDIDYRLDASIAMAMAAVGLLPLVACRRALAWLAVPLAGSVLLSVLAGPVAVLYALCALIISLALGRRKGLLSLAGLVAAVGMGLHGFHSGSYASIGDALLPLGYYPHWHSGRIADFLPWAAMAGVLIAAVAVRPLASSAAIRPWVLPALSCIISAGALGWMVGSHKMRPDDSFARMWLHSSDGEWDKVEAGFKDVDRDNPTMQNFINLAMAEKGTLCDYLFWHPNNGVAALHDAGNKNPYAYMLLSDVYYSMGFIALAKRYAFEANEALGNASPRMLMRLVDTNIATADYAVAEKYLDILACTRHYAVWTDSRRRLLFDDSAVEADPLLGAKRRCVFPADRFAGSRGIADDMLQVLRANPAHTSTMQYLGAYYMLSRNIPALIALIEEFHGCSALKQPLPVHFQEAVVVDGLINGNGIDSRFNIHPSVVERCRAFWAEHKPQPNSLWQYLKRR